ncbi:MULTISPECIES: serine/threonine-protein kinase [unclassified Okeania]|uniref:serine/threonine-protein kinase n=1 Tax=unclassified Okeania TaxID=2634635 RepID=UPI0013BE569B|nr:MULTISPECIES: serine/threonine-protein kinase [unclassified Okeania]NES77124.1 serine/threonine protein kinase [Okeania sp. SIO1H4]NET12423.1 serine/threonine protein kinase [Okeania sp. SIO1H6]NET22862.1 serine/threonine protein kinase [Okeania sp. SIO1H5]NET93893.1 serine/threonine protein kinase [Okeania sp. SIO1H2]
MSYCYFPTCKNPQNPTKAEFCQSCNSPLLLIPPLSDENEKIETKKIISSPDNNLKIANQSRYRILKLIGQGGFGRTFLAVDEKDSIRQVCVIKQFFPQNTNYYHYDQNSLQSSETISGSESLQVKTKTKKASELFQQEAQQLKTLGIHSQIPKLLTYFQKDGQQYLVQEYIEGKNLAQELAEKGIFTEAKIREFLNNLLPVLQFVHKSKVIHRDIKPENIIRRTTGQLVLVDFGAAKLVEKKGLPQTGTIIGSAAYTAPEQLMGKAIFASDLYSLGVTCIHLLTQVSPFDLFDSRNSKWVWRDYLKMPVSKELGLILDKMLEGATNRRYHSATAIIRHLKPRSNYMENVYFSPSSAVPKRLTEQAEIRRELQEVLATESVKVQVSRVKKTLTVVISRNSGKKANYAQILRTISGKLTDLRLQNIDKVKLLGKLQGKTVPEWQQVLRMDRKARWKNQILRLQKNEHFMKILQLGTQNFWWARFKEKEFWLDALMFAFAWFIFGYRIIIWHPIMAVIIASVFITVKHLVIKQNKLATNNLFTTVATVFLILGLLGGKLWISDIFGLLLGCLFVALPIFYAREEI